MTEQIKPNDSHEAYTENHVDRRGDRTPLSLIQPRQIQKADGDGFNSSEANTKEPLKVRFWRVCRGQERAWYVWKEALRTWETL